MGEKTGVGAENLVLWFSRINKSLVNLVGIKGANLGEIYNKKFPVPEGFVVTTESFKKFLESLGLKEKIEKIFGETNFKDFEEVKRNCEKVKEFFVKAELPEEVKEEIFDFYETLGANKLEIEKGSALDILNNATEPVFVSVRSSLTFEGSGKLREQNTYLNVKGNDSLLSHIKMVFVSLFNPETLSRIFSEKFDFEKLKIAVVVQKMIPAEKSGSVVSRDSSGNISIYSIWGLGEGKNVKEITPDNYILSRELEVLDRKIGEKSFMVVRDSSGNLKSVKSSDERKNSQVLNNYEIQRIGDLAEKAESHFGNPQELEFSIDESGIYILQTGEVKDKTKVEEVKESEEKVEETQEIKEVERVGKVTKTKLKLLLDSPYMISEGNLTGLKKVGILKIEKVIGRTGKHPFYFLDSHYINQYENLVYDGIKNVFQNFEEVWVRTSDFLSEDFSGLEGDRDFKEKNPLLGLHGIRFGLKYPEILEAELRAIKRAHSESKVGILIPNLISIEELKKVRELLKKINFEDCLVGILIETPAAVQLIKEFCSEKVDAVVINTDRLIQYLLAADMENKEVSKFVREVHPSFSYQMEYLVRVAKRNEIETNIFGKILEEKEVLEHLVKRGIDFITVEPEKAKGFAEEIHKIEEDLFGGTDSEPREYEIKKSKEDYIKEESKEGSEEKVKSIVEDGSEPDEKIEEDLKLIEEEKGEYLSQESSGENFSGVEEENLEDSEEKNLENSEEENLEDSEEDKGEVLHEELKESPNEEFDEGVEEVKESKDIKEKDELGIF